MGYLNFNNKKFSLPRFLNGISLRKIFGLGKDRSLYSTDHYGKNRIIHDDDTIDLENTSDISDLPYTERG